MISVPPYHCSHCGAEVRPFQMPPHGCPGVLAQVAADELARTPLPLPKIVRTPMAPGDTVEWTERAAQGRHERRTGVVSRLVDGGRGVLIRTGATLIELNMGQVTRVAKSKTEASK
jgi:hypothetical protein